MLKRLKPHLQERWLLQLAIELLKDNENVKRLLRQIPVVGAPKKIRMDLYQYKMPAPFGQGWWVREYVRPYMPEIGLDSPSIQPYLE